jgi:transcriptional regulator with XRE-family HTH domain
MYGPFSQFTALRRVDLINGIFMVCQHVAYNMARRNRLTGEQRRIYDDARKQGYKDYQIATELLGVSPGTLSGWKTGRSKPRQSTIERIEDFQQTITVDRYTDDLIADVDTKITIDELLRLSNRGGNPRTRRLAQEKLTEIEQDFPDLDFEDLTNMTFDRPTYYRMIGGKRINMLLGRTKGEINQEAIRKQLRTKGINVDDDYSDFGGYGSGF